MLNLGLNLLALVNRLKHKEHPLAILYFHRVLDAPTPYCPDDWTAQSFDTLIEKLNRYFNLVSISEGLRLQEAGKLPKKSLAISFDDGYLDNFEHALPILQKHHTKASFFIASLGTERGYLWNDELEQIIRQTESTCLTFQETDYDLSSEQLKANAYLELVGKLKVLANDQRDAYLAKIRETLGQVEVSRCMMDKAQLVKLQDLGHDVGAHTHTHSILSYQSDDVANDEIQHSIQLLNSWLEKRVELFAYPNGWVERDFTDTHQDMVKEGAIRWAVATNDGGVTSKSNKFALPRFMPHRKEFNQFCLSIEKIAGE